MKKLLLTLTSILALTAIAYGAGQLASAYTANGTAGGGYVEIANQSVAPSTPTAAGRLYFDSSNYLAWKNSGGFIGRVDLGGANRTLTFSGDPTLGNWFDQSVKTTASPTFVNVTANLTGNITGSAPAGSLTGTTLAANVITSLLTSVGTLDALTVTAPISGSVTGSSGSATGNAATATALQTARTINGVSFNGTASIGQDLQTSATPTFASAILGTGSASTNGLLVLDGATTANFGSLIRFNRGGAIKWQLGHSSGILGGSSDALVLYDQAAGATMATFTTGVGLGFNGVITIGSLGAVNSIDPQVIVSRTVGGSGTYPLGNAHAFSDSSNVTRTGGVAYNSYDARITTSGSANFDHYAAFQAAPDFQSAGTTDKLYGFLSAMNVGAGTVTNLKHFSVLETTGAGTVTTQYGLWIPSLAKGATNYSVFTAGSGLVSIGDTTEATAYNAASVMLSGGLGVTKNAAFNGTIGVGAAPSINRGIYVNGNYTGASPIALALYPTLTADANGRSLFGIVGSNGTIATSTYTGLLYRGIYLSVPGLSGSGTITNATQLYIEAPIASGGGVTVTNRFSIYSAGGRNYFGGGIEIPSSPPASATATGVAGTIAWDSSYIYICIATDTWKRVAISSW